MNYSYAADRLMDIAQLLKTFDSVELQQSASMLIMIGAEVRKLHRPPAFDGLTAADLKPTPPRTDPSSKIPRPPIPPKGAGPIKLALTN